MAATFCNNITESIPDKKYITNKEIRLRKKVNRIGTLTETLDAIAMASWTGYAAIQYHRSGETEDATIAEISVTVNTGQIKTDAPT